MARNLPWHLLRRNNYATDSERERRMDICRSCPEFIRATQQCAECGCFMHLKTKLREAECPLQKWGKQ